MDSKWRIAGVNFSHMHMGDLLRCVDEHPNAEIVGICDERHEEMQEAIESLSICDDRVFTDCQQCMRETKPEMVILCPPTGEHADWTERIAPFGAHLFVEKPFAASLADADRMIAAAEQSGKELVINWPARWDRTHYTAWCLINDGLIGDVLEVHYYGGNRGPLYHGADKVEYHPTTEDKQNSWWYKAETGGGSLRDYLGYGVTLGTWFNGGQKPIDVTAVVASAEGVEVDEHSVTIARYAHGLSKFETRWGTFTDPWIHQPQPKCGFVIRGSDGGVEQSKERIVLQEGYIPFVLVGYVDARGGIDTLRWAPPGSKGHEPLPLEKLYYSEELARSLNQQRQLFNFTAPKKL